MGAVVCVVDLVSAPGLLPWVRWRLLDTCFVLVSFAVPLEANSKLGFMDGAPAGLCLGPSRAPPRPIGLGHVEQLDPGSFKGCPMEAELVWGSSLDNSWRVLDVEVIEYFMHSPRAPGGFLLRRCLDPPGTHPKHLLRRYLEP